MAELNLGLLLPGNVVLYEVEGSSMVEAMDPEPVLGMVDNGALGPIARQVNEKMRRVIEEVAAQSGGD